MAGMEVIGFINVYHGLAAYIVKKNMLSIVHE